MEQKYCNGCETTKDVSEFRKRTAAKDGLQSQCKTCMDDASKRWATTNKKHKIKLQRARRHKMLLEWREWKSVKGCKCCDETEGCCLELHHLDPNTKDINPSDMIARGYSWDNMLKEAEKCVVVCSNCHKKIHHGIIKLGD